MSFLTYFCINTIFVIYSCYFMGFYLFYSLNLLTNSHNSAENMHNQQHNQLLISPLPTIVIEKNSAVNFVDIPSTCKSPRLNLLPVTIFIRLVLSNSAKISFSISLLISEKMFLFTEKNLCWPIFWDTKSFLTSPTRGIKSCIVRKVFPQEFSRKRFPPQECAAKLVTVTNQPLDIQLLPLHFVRQNDFLFQLVENLTVTDMVGNYKSKRLCCKISVPERFGRGMHLQNRNKPNRKKIKYFSAKNGCNCVNFFVLSEIHLSNFSWFDSSS